MEILEIGIGSGLGRAAMGVRREVFVVEQGVPAEMEYDEHDATAVHLAAVERGEVVGTLRMLPRAKELKVGRVAVKKAWRGKGVGTKLMLEAMGRLRPMGCEEVVLHAQVTVEAFYEALGFAVCGEHFMEAGIEHVEMRWRDAKYEGQGIKDDGRGGRQSDNSVFVVVVAIGDEPKGVVKW